MKEAISAKEYANRALNDFLWNMSHELRTPLTGILGFSETISQSDDKADMARYAGLIYNEGEKCFL